MMFPHASAPSIDHVRGVQAHSVDNMEPYPNVEDPDAPEPRTVHIRSTALGHARSVSAPTFCGASPSLAWHLSHRRTTCAACIAEVRRVQFRIFWSG